MVVLSTDIETLGTDPKIHDTIEFAAVLWDFKDKRPVEQLPYFHTYLQPPTGRTYYQGDPYAMSMHQKILREIATHNKDSAYSVIPPSNLGFQLQSFLANQNLSGRINVVGKNFGGFDYRFLLEVENFTKDMPFEGSIHDGSNAIRLGRRFLDPAMLFWHPFEDQVLPDSKTCLKRAGLDSTLTHSALDDARQVIQLVKIGISKDR